MREHLSSPRFNGSATGALHARVVEQCFRHIKHGIVIHRSTKAIDGMTDKAKVAPLVSLALVDPIDGKGVSEYLTLSEYHRYSRQGAATRLSVPKIHQVLSAGRLLSRTTNKGAAERYAELPTRRAVVVRTVRSGLAGPAGVVVPVSMRSVLEEPRQRELSPALRASFHGSRSRLVAPPVPALLRGHIVNVSAGTSPIFQHRDLVRRRVNPEAVRALRHANIIATNHLFTKKGSARG